MEYVDIFDKNNNATGEIKEKTRAHEDGNFHRTAHIWIINDKKELLLQKRSATKKSHPNCWDISGAGHIKAGESIIDGAIRELKEELGVVETEKGLEYIATIKSTKNPKNMEFQYVYLLKCNKTIEEYTFEDNEVSEVKYVFYKDLEKIVADKVDGLLIHDEEYKILFETINSHLINQLDRFNINSNIGIAITENKKYDTFGTVYSKLISDFWYNYIYSVKANNENELNEILSLAEYKMKEQYNREFCVAILPTDKYIYDNREKLFDKDKYECISNEMWQVYTNFENVKNIITNCELNITLEKATDMNLFGNIMYQCFATGNSDDPYGELDTGYKEAYRDYKKVDNEYEQEFYLIKNENTIVGVVNAVYDKEIFGIYGLAVKSEYRNKGIGKEVSKKLLQRCKDINRKIAFLQTEKGFYPEQVYKKIGFKEICTEYYYTKKKV